MYNVFSCTRQPLERREHGLDDESPTGNHSVMPTYRSLHKNPKRGGSESFWLVNTWRYWEGGTTRKGVEAPGLSPDIWPYASLVSVCSWVLYSRLVRGTGENVNLQVMSKVRAVLWDLTLPQVDSVEIELNCRTHSWCPERIRELLGGGKTPTVGDHSTEL